MILEKIDEQQSLGFLFTLWLRNPKKTSKRKFEWINEAILKNLKKLKYISILNYY